MSSPKLAELNTKRLYQFRTLAEMGSPARACAFLGISAPALTQSVNKLEEEVGVALFDRSTRPPRLTQAGVLLLQYARKLHIETEELFERLELEQGGHSGIVRLGCGARWMVDIIPRVIGAFNRSHPTVRLSVRVGQMDMLGTMLENREISLLFGTTDRIRRLNHHRVLPVGVDRFVVVARSGHPLHARGRLSLADLMGQKWIIGEATASSTIVLRQALREAGLGMIVPTVEMSDMLAVANTLRHGDFVGLFTRSTVSRLPGAEALNVDFELPESESGVIHLADHVLSESEQALIEHVRALF